MSFLHIEDQIHLRVLSKFSAVHMYASGYEKIVKVVSSTWIYSITTFSSLDTLMRFMWHTFFHQQRRGENRRGEDRRGQ